MVLMPFIEWEFTYYQLICQTLILNNDYVFGGQSFIDVDCITCDTYFYNCYLQKNFPFITGASCSLALVTIYPMYK